MKRALLAIVSALVAITVLAPAAEARALRRCEHGVEASQNLSCRTAERVGRGYLRGIEDFVAHPSPLGFSCTRSEAQPHRWLVRCRRSSGGTIQRVRFGYE